MALIGLLLGGINRAQAQTDQPGLPTIVSITRTTPSVQVMRTSSVVFTVTFSEAVTNVNTSSFTIAPVNGGNTVATVASVSGGPDVYQVTVNITGGAGDFRLDVGPTVSTFATGFRNSSALAFDQAGNLYVGDDDDQSVKKVTSGGVVSTFATGFYAPYGIACSSAGDLYVTNNGEVKKITSGGSVSTFATGFSVACGLAFDTSGNLFVGNYSNNSISKVTPGGVVSTFATNINAPLALAFDGAGNLYAACRDAGMIAKITPGGVVTTFATGFNGPEGMWFDASGDLFVADRWANRVARVKPDGTVSTYAANMPASYGLAFDAAGAMYVTSYYNDNTVRKLTLPVITDLGSNDVPGLPYTAGETYTYDPNDAPTDIQISNASLLEPVTAGAIVGTLSSTDADPADTHTYSLVSGTGSTNNGSFVIDGDLLRVGMSPPTEGYYSVRIQSDDGQGGTYAKPISIAVGIPQITSITRKTPAAQNVGTSTAVFEVTYSEAVTGVTADGFALTPLNGASVAGTVLSVSGGPSVYEVTVQITSGTGDFRLDAVVVPPIVTTFASGFNSPGALAMDDSGNLYVANMNDGTVSKVTSGGSVSIFASGFSGPRGLAFDGQGNLFVANAWNNTISEVTNGSVSTFATGFSGPYGLAFDGQGNLFVANMNDNSVSKVTSAGSVSTFASGFNGPTALAFNAAGDLYVGNQWNNSVSKVKSDGTVTFFSDGFNGAQGLTFDGAASLYVANNWNGTISKVTTQVAFSTLASGINQPSAIVFDGAGNLYATSRSNGSIILLALPVPMKDLTGNEVVGVPFTSGQSFTRIQNATPTDIILSHAAVNQSAGTNATIGALTTTDADSGDTHVYTLVTGTGGTDNASFNLSGAVLRANNATVLNAGSCSVRVRSDDGISDPYEKVFTITVNDDIAPAAPSAFSASALNATVSLAWTNPVSDFASCTIRRSVSSYPATINSGTLVASGLTGTSLNDPALSDGTYYYAIFTLDAAGNISMAATATATVDATPPASPASFTANVNGSSITLNWTNPLSDFASCTIRRSTGSYPTTINSGSLVGSGLTGTSYANTALADGTYYYAIFALDAVGNISVAATASATVDTTAPAAPSAFNAVANGGTVALSWTNPVTDFASCTIRRSTNSYPATINSNTLVASGLTGTTFSDTGLADGIYYYAIFARDSAGNVSNAATTSVTIDTTPPVVTDARISISGASGLGGTFKIGDTVTVAWNNTVAGDNNTEPLSAVTVDFSQFGGATAIAATNSSGIWTASYTIVAGTIDATHCNVSVTATDVAGNHLTAADTTNASVDNQAPAVTAANISISGGSGTAGAFQVGDTITAIWNNTSRGDNNGDTLSSVSINFAQFGGGAAIAASNSAGLWTATCTISPGFGPTTPRNVAVTVTDNAGNTTIVTDNADGTIENTAPVNHVPGSQSVPQDGSLVFNGGHNNLVSVSDADADSANLRITLTATHGTLTLSGVAGLSFSVGTGTANVTMTFTGTITDLNRALAGLSFTPASGYSGGATLQIITNDQGNNGSGGAKTDTDSISVTVVASNRPPTDIILSHNSVNRSAVANATVGILSSTDPDSTIFTYSLVAGAGSTNNGSFNIAGTNLQINNPSSLTAGNYSIRVRTADDHGSSFEKVFSITVVDDINVWEISTSADFNGDGQPDLLWTNKLTGDRAVWLLNGIDAMTNAFVQTVPTEWTVSGTGDFNGDGKADIFWTNTLTGDRAIWLMNGGQVLGGGFIAWIPTEWQVSCTGDFNGDGKADILWTNTATGERSVWVMNGTAITGGFSLGTVPLIWQASATGDFNGDGKADIFWSNTTTGDRAMWLMNGATVITNAFITTVPVEWGVSGTGDYNGDGKADIFWTNTVTGDRAAWTMNGSTAVTRDYLGAVPLEWTILNSTGDYNADGNDDILWSNATTGQRAYWLMKGVTVIGGETR